MDSRVAEPSIWISAATPAIRRRPPPAAVARVVVLPLTVEASRRSVPPSAKIVPPPCRRSRRRRRARRVEDEIGGGAIARCDEARRRARAGGVADPHGMGAGVQGRPGTGAAGVGLRHASRRRGCRSRRVQPERVQASWPWIVEAPGPVRGAPRSRGTPGAERSPGSFPAPSAGCGRGGLHRRRTRCRARRCSPPRSPRAAALSVDGVGVGEGGDRDVGGGGRSGARPSAARKEVDSGRAWKARTMGISLSWMAHSARETGLDCARHVRPFPWPPLSGGIGAA